MTDSSAQKIIVKNNDECSTRVVDCSIRVFRFLAFEGNTLIALKKPNPWKTLFIPLAP